MTEPTLKDRVEQLIAENRVLLFMKGTPDAPACGNSIGVDRRFLDRYLPSVDRYVHYRSIDVSSLKELCRRWNPSVYKGRPGKQETHRALDDIRESLEELRYYRDHFLARPDAGESDTAEPGADAPT